MREAELAPDVLLNIQPAGAIEVLSLMIVLHSKETNEMRIFYFLFELK